MRRSKYQKDKCDRQAALFNGITLTEEQKTAIANLDKQRAEARKAACDQKQSAKKDKANKDNARRPSREQVEQQRMAQRLDYLRRMQSILTPEQYITYLENTAVNAPRFVGDNCGRKADMKKGDRRGDKKDMNKSDRRCDKKDMKKGDRRGNRAACANNDAATNTAQTN